MVASIIPLATSIPVNLLGQDVLRLGSRLPNRMISLVEDSPSSSRARELAAELSKPPGDKVLLAGIGKDDLHNFFGESAALITDDRHLVHLSEEFYRRNLSSSALYDINKSPKLREAMNFHRGILKEAGRLVGLLEQAIAISPKQWLADEIIRSGLISPKFIHRDPNQELVDLLSQVDLLPKPLLIERLIGEDFMFKRADHLNDIRSSLVGVEPDTNLQSQLTKYVDRFISMDPIGQARSDYSQALSDTRFSGEQRQEAALNLIDILQKWNLDGRFSEQIASLEAKDFDGKATGRRTSDVLAPAAVAKAGSKL